MTFSAIFFYGLLNFLGPNFRPSDFRPTDFRRLSQSPQQTLQIMVKKTLCNEKPNQSHKIIQFMVKLTVIMAKMCVKNTTISVF